MHVYDLLLFKHYLVLPQSKQLKLPTAPCVDVYLFSIRVNNSVPKFDIFHRLG